MRRQLVGVVLACAVPVTSASQGIRYVPPVGPVSRAFFILPAPSSLHSPAHRAVSVGTTGSFGAKAGSGLLWTALGTAAGVALGYSLGYAASQQEGGTGDYDYNQMLALGAVIAIPAGAATGAVYGVRKAGNYRGNLATTAIVTAALAYAPAVYFAATTDQDAAGYNPHKQIVLPTALASAAMSFLSSLVMDRLTGRYR